MQALLIIIIIVLIVMLVVIGRENLCVNRNYGVVTDIPASNFIDANMALVHDTTIGQAPLGDPRFWIPSHSPITQGQYGLYTPQGALPLSETQPFDRSSLNAAAMTLPVYTNVQADTAYAMIEND